MYLKLNLPNYTITERKHWSQPRSLIPWSSFVFVPVQQAYIHESCLYFRVLDTQQVIEMQSGENIGSVTCLPHGPQCPTEPGLSANPVLQSLWRNLSRKKIELRSPLATSTKRGTFPLAIKRIEPLRPTSYCCSLRPASRSLLCPVPSADSNFPLTQCLIRFPNGVWTLESGQCNIGTGYSFLNPQYYTNNGIQWHYGTLPTSPRLLVPSSTQCH